MINNMNDIARLAFSAYTEETYDCLAISDGKYYYGHVNECKFGDQCEGHAVYCDNEKSPYRKCRHGWYYQGNKRDKECNFFESNVFSLKCWTKMEFLTLKKVSEQLLTNYLVLI